MTTPTEPEPAETADPATPAHKRHHPPTRAEFEARAAQTRADIEAQARAAKAQFDATQEKIRARTGRNLLAAIGIGVLLGALLIVSLFLWKPLFIVFGGLLVGFTTFELASALRFAGRNVPRVASTVVGLAMVPVAFFWSVEGLWLALLAALVLITLYRLVELVRPSHRTGTREVLLDVGAGAFVQVYVAFSAGFYLALTGSPGGEWWTLAALIIVVFTDVGAYASGLRFGRHKLAPLISPGKTWEGFAGSLVVAVAFGAVLGPLVLHEPWWIGAILGLLLAVVGTTGDLMESLIKRDLGIKDISTWLPGHGGFLDRLDSILPSAVVAYAFYLLFA
ncbi:MAG TPA: phosphatidate cytidylyltransferase [Pseudolysinimonas sp.]|jgi:phosphatidate cytidylyltransferase|nr:phosphatidate cytidylyltransferase [Pseudolysinimonas sp.]